MKNLSELPAHDDHAPVCPIVEEASAAGANALTITVGTEEEADGSPSAIDAIIKEYSRKNPGVFSVGGTFGIDTTAFRLEVDTVFVSVTGLKDKSGQSSGKLLTIQGMAYFQIAKLFKASAAVIGEYDTDVLSDPLELFNKDMDDDEKREAVRYRNTFGNLVGDTIMKYDLVDDGSKYNGLYFLFDGSNRLTEKQYVFTATGLMDLLWVEKIGVNCALKLGVIGAYNSFEKSWEVGLGVKVTIPIGKDWMVVGRVGFKSGQINTIAFEVRGEIPIGPVVFTQIKMGVSGMADSVQSYSPGLGVAFGPEVNFKALVSPVAKVLGLKVGSFRVAEVGVSGEVSSDFNDVNLTVEGKLFGLVEIKGGWKRKNGNYNEISLSVGTKNSSTFNFLISGSVGWANDQLTINGSLNGSFKWDFTALGVNWVGVNVAGGLNVVYNQINTRKTLSITAFGRAKVKVAFVKVGVNVGKSWFVDLSGSRTYSCENARLSTGGRSASTGGTEDAAGDDGAEKIASYTWSTTELATSGRMYVTLAVQNSLTDMKWVMYGADGSVYTSDDPGAVTVKQVSYSQFELTVDNPAEGDWTLEAYGSKNRNGEVCIFAEAGDPIETGLRIVSSDREFVTVEYMAHATGENTLVALYMQRADRPDDEYEGTILRYFTPTDENEYRRVDVALPEDIQGGEYKLYLMAQSTNCAEIAYSAKTEALEIVRRAADLCVTDYRVEFSAADPQKATVLFTVSNPGSMDADDFLVEILLGDSKLNTDDDEVVAWTRISLAAGASRQLELEAEIPPEYLGKLAVMSIRLDSEQKIAEGIFEENNTEMKTLSFSAKEPNSAQAVQWTAVEGAVSYDLAYAAEGEWNDSACLRGITQTSAVLAPGNYSFHLTPYDAAGEVIVPGIREWDDCVLFSSDFGMTVADGAAVSEKFALMDGFYDWRAVDLGNFTGKVTLYQVDAVRRGKDAKVMALNVSAGKVKKLANATDMLLDNGLYYFTAAAGSSKIASDISFSLTGDIFPNLDVQRGIVSLPDCVNAEGVYTETLSGWVGAFDGEDTWEYLLENAGELSISVNDPGTLTGALRVELYVQKGNSGRYSKVHSCTVDSAAPSAVLLEDFAVTNNFYVQVSALDSGKGKHNSDYTLDLKFAAFDSTPLAPDEWTLCAGEEEIRVDGWVGYRKESDTYLLTVNSGSAGKYSFKLAGDAAEATLKVRSISGKLIKSAKLDKQDNAAISSLALYTGDYLVEIDSVNKSKNINNTDYALTVSQDEAFTVISVADPAEVARAEKKEKLFYELDIDGTGMYDVSELVDAGLKVGFQKADGSGSLKSIKLSSGQVELEDGIAYYMTVSNNREAWGEVAIELDPERRKLKLTPMVAVGN